MGSHNEGARTCSTLRRQLLTLVRILAWRRSVTLAAGNPDPKPLDLMTIDKLQKYVKYC